MRWASIAALSTAVTVMALTRAPGALGQDGSLWNLNGSVMALSIEGEDWTFKYRDPRVGMIEEGVRSGTTLFSGQREGENVTGTAYRFSRRCGAIPYDVEGELQTDGTLVMYGEAPIQLDDACNPIGHKNETLVFQPLSTEGQGTSVASAIYRSYRVIGVTADDVLNIRSEPTSDSEAVGHIPATGRGVSMTGACQGEWCPVEYRGVSGWANATYLTREDASAPETTPKPTKPAGTVFVARAKTDICQSMVKAVVGVVSKERASAVAKSLSAQCERCFTDSFKKGFSTDELYALDAKYDTSYPPPDESVSQRADEKYSALFTTCSERMIATAAK